MPEKYDSPILIGPTKDDQFRARHHSKQGFRVLLVGILVLFARAGGYYSNISESALLKVLGTSLLCYGLYLLYQSRNQLRIQFTRALDDMSPSQFESFIEELYCKMGYDAKNLPRIEDPGVDVLARRNGVMYAIKAQHLTSNMVSSSVVRSLYESVPLHRADKGIIVTNSYFLESAINAARKYGIKLIDRDALKKMIIENYQPVVYE